MRKVKYKSVMQLVRFHALNLYTWFSLLPDIPNLIFQRYLQLKIFKTELLISLLSIVLPSQHTILLAIQLLK